MKRTITFFVAILLVITAFSGCGNADSGKNNSSVNKSYEDAAELLVRLITGEDLSKSEVRSMQPEALFSKETEDGISFSEYYEQVQQQIKTNKNAMISAFGKDYKVSYEIKADKKISAEEQHQATKHLNSNTWYDAGDLEEVRVLTLELSVDGDEIDRTFKGEIQTMKLGKSWYILACDFSELESFLN